MKDFVKTVLDRRRKTKYEGRHLISMANQNEQRNKKEARTVPSIREQ